MCECGAVEQLSVKHVADAEERNLVLIVDRICQNIYEQLGGGIFANHLQPPVRAVFIPPLMMIVSKRTADTLSSSGRPCRLPQISRAALWGFFVTVE